MLSYTPGYRSQSHRRSWRAVGLSLVVPQTALLAPSCTVRSGRERQVLGSGHSHTGLRFLNRRVLLLNTDFTEGGSGVVNGVTVEITDSDTRVTADSPALGRFVRECSGFSDQFCEAVHSVRGLLHWQLVDINVGRRKLCISVLFGSWISMLHCWFDQHDLRCSDHRGLF